jgi:hypothetical protein
MEELAMSFLRSRGLGLAMWASVFLSLFSIPLVAQTEVVFPQVFRVDDANTSAIYVQNLNGTTGTEVSVFFINQDGTQASAERRSLPPLGSARFDAPLVGFEQGTARVSCLDTECSATATWNFALGNREPVAVGVAPMDPSVSSTRWGAPIPSIDPDSGFGVAVLNAGTNGTSCSIFYYTADGTEVQEARDGFPSAAGIPVGGQTAFLSVNFPSKVPPELIGPDGFEGSMLLTCFEPVIPMILDQNKINGFPTPINMKVRTVEQPQ